MLKRARNWVVVADGARSRIFAPSTDLKRLVAVRAADPVSPASRIPSSKLASDGPGRAYASSRTNIRHALHPKKDHQKLEKHRFLAGLADELDAACQKKEFDGVILVAPRRCLGELRTLLSKRVKACVRAEVAHDLTKDTATNIMRHIKDAVVSASIVTPK